MAWLYLAIASLFEICWVYCIKYLTWSHLLKINWLKLNSIPSDYLVSLIAFSGYIFFGIANITMFSMATKIIPASIAFGVWTAIVLIGTRIIDLTVFKEPYSHIQLLFMLLIIVGIIGLKISSDR